MAYLVRGKSGVTLAAHMRIGLYGGMFDPIHYGHLRAAVSAIEHFALDKVFFIPCANPPHRTNLASDFTDRVTMLNLVAAHDTRFKVDPREAKLPKPSYTYYTLLDIKAAHSAEYYWLLGWDAFSQFSTWHQYEAILNEVPLIVFNRDDSIMLGVKEQALLNQYQAQRIHCLPNFPLNISSTHLRSLYRNGKSARYWLPDAVDTYILEHQLYLKE